MVGYRSSIRAMPARNTTSDSAQAPPFSRRTLVLIPALNEEASIGPVIRHWLALGFARVRVVENGSADRTGEVARTAGAEVVFEPRRGYGQACWTGLREWPEDLDWILFSSADGSDWLEADELRQWQQAITDGARIILGDRTALETSRQELKPVQRFGNSLSSGLIRLGWGVRHRDMSSLRLVRRSAFDAMDLADRGFGWNVEMHVRAAELDLRVAEVPVLYRPRTGGVSKISGTLKGSFQAGTIILGTLGKLWWSRAHRLGLSRNPNQPKPINGR